MGTTKIDIKKIAQNTGQITGLPANPRQWKKADVERLAKSIEETPELLDARPLIVIQQDDKYIVLGGNLRLAALKHLGRKTAPVYILPEDTPTDKQKEIVIKDNGSFGEWDYDVLANEWDDLPLADWGVPSWETETEEVANVTEDDFDEDTDEIPVRCQKGDIWQLGDHRLMCGDSTDLEAVKRLMGEAKADMAFTDPPYGVQYTGGIQFKANGEVVKDNREMIKNDDADIYASVFPMLSKFVRGACYVWFAGTKAASLYNAAQKCGEIHALIIWVKNGGYGALNANYKQKHEPCLYWKPKNGTLNFIGPTTETTIWEINKDGVNEYHPTQKPVALAAKAIGNHKADAVLDLFGGSGTTLIAAEQLGRRCYMMELDPHFCDVIIARWEKLTGKEAVKYGK